MAIFKPNVKGVTDLLKQIFADGAYADKAIATALKEHKKWGARDRSFIAETTYEMVRWWRLISEALDEEKDTSEAHYYRLFAAWQIINDHKLPEWEEFNNIDKSKIKANAERLRNIRKVRESVPDWMDEMGCAELGEEVWTKELAELNIPAKLVLRANTLKTSVLKLQKQLVQSGVESSTIPRFPDGLIATKKKNLYQTDEYNLGLFEIQDGSSQLVAPFLQAEEGMTVIDACAGAGGKSLHIATLMNNKGRVISMDVEEKKLIELNKRAKRNGISTIETKLITADALSKFENTADRLLLDVPCSGMGVLRRKPFDKWKLTPETIADRRKEQQQILTRYSKMVKPGGLLVYATCSILPSENQNQIFEFLQKTSSDFEFLIDRKVLPSEGFDGFYMAKLQRKE